MQNYHNIVSLRRERIKRNIRKYIAILKGYITSILGTSLQSIKKTGEKHHNKKGKAK